MKVLRPRHRACTSKHGVLAFKFLQPVYCEEIKICHERFFLSIFNYSLDTVSGLRTNFSFDQIATTISLFGFIIPQYCGKKAFTSLEAMSYYQQEYEGPTGGGGLTFNSVFLFTQPLVNKDNKNTKTKIYLNESRILFFTSKSLCFMILWMHLTVS